jgi:hypothetical protein
MTQVQLGYSRAGHSKSGSIQTLQWFAELHCRQAFSYLLYILMPLPRLVPVQNEAGWTAERVLIYCWNELILDLLGTEDLSSSPWQTICCQMHFYIGLNLLHAYHGLEDIPTSPLSPPNITITSWPAFKPRLCDIFTRYLALIAGWWFKMEAELSNWIRGWEHLRKLLHLYVANGRQNRKLRCLRHWWFSTQRVPSGNEEHFFTRLRQLWIHTKFRTPFAASIRPLCCTVFCSFLRRSKPSWPGSYVFIFIRSLLVSDSLPPPHPDPPPKGTTCVTF